MGCGFVCVYWYRMGRPVFSSGCDPWSRVCADGGGFQGGMIEW